MGDLIKITDLTKKIGLSSRTLRYYEEVGLIKSVRPQFEAYRYYDSKNTERLHQIMILRKMQIPVKDIISIYENAEISQVVNIFCRKIDEINKEITSLSELKNIINTFIKKMYESGIKSITAMPLLYDEMENQFNLIEEKGPVGYSELERISSNIEKKPETAIISLPAMRVISSFLKNDINTSDTDGFRRFIQSEGMDAGSCGNRNMFEFQTESGDAAMLRISDNYNNNSLYADFVFPGGLYAFANAYADEDLNQKFKMLVKSFDDNSFYQIDYGDRYKIGSSALVEELISPDEKRDLLCIYVPVKKRFANAGLFDKPSEMSCGEISAEDIGSSDTVLWKKDIPLGEIKPVNGPYYRVLENGEAEYVGWIKTRVLDTGVAVRLPYRVDIEFKITHDREGFENGADEGSIYIYRGDGNVYMSLSGEYFGINTENNPSDNIYGDDPARKEAIEFGQPVFHDKFSFPHRGKIRENEYNRFSITVGEKYLAFIINGEVRYCGTDFPYMSLNMSMDTPQNIYIGSDGQRKKYFKSVSISQLEYTKKNNINKKELTMFTSKSNNTISVIHRLVTDEYGENFWFNGCARYVMECLGENDFDYSFFAGVNGDSFAQYYPKNGYMGDSVSEYMLSVTGRLQETEDKLELVEDGGRQAECVFEKCGYSSTFVSAKMLSKNTQMYLSTLISYIDKGVPVIFWGLGEPAMGVFVGYEEYGKRLLYITGNNDKPLSIDSDKAIQVTDEGWAEKFGWIFVGEKKENISEKDIYRNAIISLPKLLRTETDRFYLGSGAFRAWANDIESGCFDSIRPEEFDPWFCYTTYVCDLATIGSCCHGFLDKALRLNPDMTFLKDVSSLYRQYELMWKNDNGEDLEAIVGGFNVTLGALQDKQRREKIALTLRKFADVTDEIIKTLNDGIADVQSKA